MADAALAALRTAARAHSMTRGAVKAKSVGLFGKELWSDLSIEQRWTLVCSIEPPTVGPYGHSMEPF